MTRTAYEPAEPAEATSAGNAVSAAAGFALIGVLEEEKLVENASTLIDVVVKAKPAASKGTYLKKISVSTTMGPGLVVDHVAINLWGLVLRQEA